MSAEKLKIQVEDKVLTASLEKNSSVEALTEMLREGPLTISMSDYAGMEKVGPIGKRLPTNDKPIHAKPCDLILYLGNSFVIYYEPNSWNFTKQGRIEGVSQKELKKILGRGDVTITLKLGENE